MNTFIKGSFTSLTPLFVFVGLFLSSSLLFAKPISPLFACLVAIMFSFATFTRPTPFNKKVELFIEGGAHSTILAMTYIFIFSAVFTYVIDLIGGIHSAVRLGLYCLSGGFILPGLFTVVSFFSVAIGSSMGSIAAFLPIAKGIADTTSISPSLMAGVVVSGAMLGDNLSLISDTTIAATQTTGTKMADKFKSNVKLVIPAYAITALVLYWINSLYTATNSLPTTAPTVYDVSNIVPYALVIILALAGIDVIAVLLLGIVSAISIGIAKGDFSPLQSTNLILEAFGKDTGAQEVLILALLMSGLSYIVQYNGGISYLLQLFQKKVNTKAHAETSIALLVFLVNAAIGINTIAILITGPVVKKIGDQFNISGKRIASLIDVVACICQGILPYAPQLLLAGSLAGVSSISIMPYLYYQWAILFVLVYSIFLTWFGQKGNSAKQAKI